MILPWLQVAEEAFERAVELAAVLEIEEAQALGHLVFLWRWALSRPADEGLTGVVAGPTAIAQIEAGARWKGPRGKLVEALFDLGLVADDPTGHRVKGLERYREQLEKRAQDRERKARSAASDPSTGIPAEVRRKQTGKSGQTQTQTQTQKEQLPLSAEKPADRAVVVFEHWRRVMGKNARTAFDKPRRKAVEARIADGYTIDDLRRAIDGCALTPHNMGTNEKNTRYDDLELICRDAAHVDRFRATAIAAGPPAQARPDFDAMSEVAVLAKPFGAHLVAQLEQCRWQRTDEGFVGFTEDAFFADWLISNHGEQLGPLGIGIDASRIGIDAPPKGAAA